MTTNSSTFKKALKPFQKVGAKFLASNFHAMLADEMGLGKTVQALAAVHSLGLKNILIVCPASVRLGWRQEIEECGLDNRNFDVVSYNAVAAGKNCIYGGARGAIIIDEAHFCKSIDSQRSKALLGKSGVARHAVYKWCLTGTPVLNRPSELYTILKTLAPQTIHPYTSWDRFTARYCGAFWDGYSVNTKGASNLAELSKNIAPFMLRRTKAEVLPELPPRIVNHTPLEISAGAASSIYEAERGISNRESYLSSTHESYAQLGDLATLLKITGVAKVGAVHSFVEDLLETEDKVVIFTKHREVLAQLAARFKAKGIGAVTYQGGMNDAGKRAAVATFVGDKEVRVFIGQITAAGTGINGLQNVCNTVVFAELSWVPGEMAQAIDRCHRMGQTRGSVNVHLLHVKGTLESAMLQVHLAKQSVIDKLVGANT